MIIQRSIYSKIGVFLVAVSLSACSPPRPHAEVVAVQELGRRIESSKAPLTLVHVWATWCDPCREEFPELVRVMKRFPSVEYILVSADDPAETGMVEQFLVENKSPAGALIVAELNQAFIELISPSWRGALPSTFFFRKGKLVEEWEGKRSFEQYNNVIETLLNR